MEADTSQTSSLRIEVIKRPGFEVSRDFYEPGANENEIKIGRHPTCHICVEYMLISKYHLLVRHTEAGWVLIDKESVNYTYINREMLPQNEPYLLTNYETLVDLGSPSRDLSVRLRIINRLGQPKTTRQDLHHDPQLMRFFLRGGPVTLTNPQYRVLLFMYDHREEVCSYDRIGKICWENYEPNDLERYAAIYELMNKLRKSLSDALPKGNMDDDAYDALKKLIKDSNNGLIITYRGFGYELQVSIPDPVTLDRDPPKLESR